MAWVEIRGQGRMVGQPIGCDCLEVALFPIPTHSAPSAPKFPSPEGGHTHRLRGC